jgi:hypothetical protein
MSEAAVPITRTQIDALPARVDELMGDGGDPVLLGAAVVIATAALHLRCTVVRPDDVRQAEVWLSSAGALLHARQASPDDPAPLVSVPPSSAWIVVARALDPDPALQAGSGPSPGTMVLDEWCDAARSGGAGVRSVHVVDELEEDGAVHRRPLVLVGLGNGWWADLDGAVDRTSPLRLSPMTPWQLTAAVSSLVAGGVAVPPRAEM